MSDLYYIVDVYEYDVGGKPNWPAVASAPNFIGGIIKATEGLYYNPSWFATNWPAVKVAGGDAYGQTWFRGSYHYLKFNADGAAQADYYLGAIDKAGGFDVGDIIPIVDVELGNDGKPDQNGKVHQRDSNQDASPQQIIDCTSAFAQRVKAVTGQQVMLYGGGAMREKNITDRMNCDWLWTARYDSILPVSSYQSFGWDVPQLALWQYCGDGQGFLKGAPTSIPNFGAPDISVVTLDSVSDFQNKVCAQVITVDK